MSDLARALVQIANPDVFEANPRRLARMNLQCDNTVRVSRVRVGEVNHPDSVQIRSDTVPLHLDQHVVPVERPEDRLEFRRRPDDPATALGFRRVIPMQSACVTTYRTRDLHLDELDLADILLDVGVIEEPAVVWCFALESQKRMEIPILLQCLQKSILSVDTLSKDRSVVHTPAFGTDDLPPGQVLAVEQGLPSRVEAGNGQLLLLRRHRHAPEHQKRTPD